MTGNRIYYNQFGEVIFQTGETIEEIERKKETINYIDLPYGDKTLLNVLDFHIENGNIIVDKKVTPKISEELLKIKELENQLLIQADKNIGGIL